jgi:cyclopropane-fatty-acyl-phospholipid synthase
VFASTAALRREIEAALPARPFSLDFWDGTALASTTGDGPAFHVRSPDALVHALRAPGQLGIGRAYVSGQLEVDDLDKAIELLDGWRPPRLDRGARARLALAALRAASFARAAAGTAANGTLAPSGTTTTCRQSSSRSSSTSR